MERRFFVSAVGAIAAVAASAAAGQAADIGSASNGMPSIPEPDPITVDPATMDRARKTLDALANDTFDRSQLSPKLSSISADFFSRGASEIKALGPVQSMYPFEKRITADQTSTFFRVRYPKNVLTFVFSVDDSNRIVGLSLRRAVNNIIFGAVDREVYY